MSTGPLTACSSPAAGAEPCARRRAVVRHLRRPVLSPTASTSGTPARRGACIGSATSSAASRTSFDRELRRGARLPGARPPRHDRAPYCCRPLTSRSATATRPSSATSRSTLPTTGSSASSGRTAPARPPCCGCSPARESRSSGSVTLDGVPLRTLPRAQIARRMAVVPQETQLAFEYTRARGGADGTLPAPRRVRARGPRDIVVAREAASGHRHARPRSRARSRRSAAARSSASSSPPRWRRSLDVGRGRLQPACRTGRRRILLLDEPTAALDLKYQLEVAVSSDVAARRRTISLSSSRHTTSTSPPVSARRW